MLKKNEYVDKLTAHVIASQNERGKDISQHTVYVIAVCWNGKEWNVSHRFRDFDILRQNLSLYNLKLPPLPPKTWFGRNLDPNFIRQRCEDLNDFLQALLKLPELLQVNYFINFLSINKNTVFGADINHSLTLDDFELLKVLGIGSFGKVFQVMKKDTKKIYAMKVLKKSELVRRKQILHTKTERRVLEDIDHPFIVSLRFAFQTSIKLYMVMDFFTGGELFFHLKKVGRFTEDRARFYMAEILLAFEHLHKMNIIYRDLKPENILLDADGHVRLTDFGLSKDFNSSGETLTRTFCGTPEYLAPEIIRRKTYDQMVDWWSFGTLLFELLAGGPPFMDTNQKVMYERILHADIPFTRRMSTLAKVIISLLLKKNPKVRLGSKHGAREVKSHPFFANIDFTGLLAKEVTPPFKPKVMNESDTQNIDDEFKNQNPKDTPGTINSGLSALDFSEFTYVQSDGKSESKSKLSVVSDHSGVFRKFPSREELSTFRDIESKDLEKQKLVESRLEEGSGKEYSDGFCSRDLSHSSLDKSRELTGHFSNSSLDKSREFTAKGQSLPIGSEE